MSNLYDTIEQLCKAKGVTITQMCRDGEISRAPLSDLKMGRTKQLSTDTLSKIAKFLDVTTDFLLDKSRDVQTNVNFCNQCGFYYNAEDPEEISAHNKRHEAWYSAVQVFGFCWQYIYREEKKAEARNKINDGKLTDDEYFKSQTDVFMALFSRSLEASGYNLKHVDFPTYVSMLLYQDEWKRKIPKTVYQMFFDKYGAKPGIPHGTYYILKEKKDVDHKDDTLSVEESEIVKRYRNLSESKKKAFLELLRGD